MAVLIYVLLLEKDKCNATSRPQLGVEPDGKVIALVHYQQPAKYLLIQLCNSKEVCRGRNHLDYWQRDALTLEIISKNRKKRIDCITNKTNGLIASRLMANKRFELWKKGHKFQNKRREPSNIVA